MAPEQGTDPTTVIVERQLGSMLPQAEGQNVFTFAWKRRANGALDPFYAGLVADRGIELLEGLAGPSLISDLAQQAVAQPGEAGDDKALMVASQLEQIGQDIGAQRCWVSDCSPM